MKRILLTDEAFRRLAVVEREDGRFSDLILRLTSRRSLVKSAGLLTHCAVEDMRRVIERSRMERLTLNLSKGEMAKRHHTRARNRKR